jgi:integrase
MGKDLKGKDLGTGITQRKNGLYCGSYTDRFGRRKNVYDRRLASLKRELTKCIAEDQKFLSLKDEITLDDWFDRWMEVYKQRAVRPNTLREYDHIYRTAISPELGMRRLTELAKSDIQLLIDKADKEGYGYERQNKIRVMLVDMFQRAVEDDLLVKNPASGVKTRKKKEFHARALSLAEQEEFFRYSKGNFYENLFVTAVNSGLRPGELFGLTEADVDFEAGVIHVNKTLVYQKYLTDTCKTFHLEKPKTRQSNRDVPMNSVCREALGRQVKQKEEYSQKYPKEQNDYLFTTKFNTPLNSVLYSAAIDAVLKRINADHEREGGEVFARFSGHAFRHTFATRCFEAGVSTKVVQQYLGHASLKMTMDLYTHVTRETAENEIEKIAKISAYPEAKKLFSVV